MGIYEYKGFLSVGGRAKMEFEGGIMYTRPHLCNINPRNVTHSPMPQNPTESMLNSLGSHLIPYCHISLLYIMGFAINGNQ